MTEPVAETTGGVDKPAVEAAGKARGDQRRLVLGKFDYLVAVEITIGEVEFVNDVVFAAAGEEPFAARREAQAIKGLRHDNAGDDAASRHLDDHDGVRPVARMQDGGPLALGVESDVDRKVADLDLPAGRPQRPLVGQQDRAAGLSPRQLSRKQSGVCRRSIFSPGGERAKSQERESQKTVKFELFDATSSGRLRRKRL